MERSGQRAELRHGSVYQLLRMAHALFWSAAAIIFTTLILLSPVLRLDLAQALVGGTTLAGIGLLCSLLVGFPLAVVRTARGIVLRTLLLLAAWFALFAGFSYRMRGAEGLARETLYPTLFIMVLLLAGWVAIAFLARGAAALQEQAVRAERALADARGERLARLRSQLAPHFIGNALNAIASRIDDAPQAAQRMTADLADLVRDALRDLGDEGTVAEEIERLRPYLALEQARFEDRLELELKIDPAVLQASLPPLLLQPLVENAIRHGAPEVEGAPLSVCIELGRGPGGELLARVTNPGHLANAAARSPDAGVGLENVRRRLRELYPSQHELALSEHDGLVEARLRLWSHAA
jgi:histidine kinase